MEKRNILLKIISLTICVFIIVSCTLPVVVKASSMKDSAKKIVLKTVEDIEKYVDESKYPGYKEKLLALRKANPNWKFTLYYTGIDWKTAVYNETKGLHGRSLVQGKTGEWLCEQCGTKVYDKGGWMCASEKAVAYLMDTRNYLITSYIFQFEELSYDPSYYTIDGIEKVLNGTFMYKKSIRQYYNNSNFEDITFSKAIMEAANSSGVSPYYLAARIRQEIGVNGSDSIYGTYKGYEGYYNFYNIGANSGTDPIGNGLKFASNTTMGKYLLPWDDPAKAIKGGAIWIATNYIAIGQDTLYFQKFDVVSNGTPFYTHQYMQNIFAAKNEGYTTYSTYNKLGLLDNNYNFIIPVYENMPKALSAEPKNDLNKPVVPRLSLKTTSKALMIGKTYNIEIKENNTGTLTYKSSNTKVAIVSSSGKVTAKSYGTATISVSGGGITKTCKIEVKKIPTKITLSATKKTLGVKEGYKVSVKLSPSGAYYGGIKYSSSNTKVATVSANGQIAAKKTGTATITVKSSNGKTAKIKITVKKAPSRISLSAKSKTIRRGRSYTVKSYLPSGSAGKVTYSTSNSKVATVSSTGKITGKKKGTTTITARTYNGKTAKIKVTVK